MGQYYSSASGGDPSRGDASGSLPSSPRSSEGWRMSMASTATVASSATANSDDTLAKDMSELSSINSRLSYLDEAQDDVKVHSLNQNTDPDIIPKETPQPDQTRQTSIKDAIDELESIEQAAQTLLLKRQCSDDERATPVPGDASRTKLSGEKIFFSDQHLSTETYELKSGDSTTVDSAQNIYENSNNSERYAGVDKPESSFSPENVHKNDRYTKEEKVSVIISEDKPPLPPTAGSQPPKVEVKRRWFSRSKEIQPYISRESYNNDKIFKELERLRRSFQESDLNDFLDTLENTAIPDDMDEAFLRQLLLDIREDVEGPPPLAEGDAQLTEDAEIIEAEAATPVPDAEAVAEAAPRQTATGSKFEKVKERILEMIKVRKKDKGKDGDDADTPNLQKDDSLSNELLKDDSSRSETPQISRSITPQSLRPDTPDSKSNRPLTPDSSKGDESKKGFNIAEFLKKGSPKYLRKKYKERKNRKSDVLTTSESESEDAEGYRKDVNYSNNLSQKKTILTDSQSSLKGSNRSLTASQELKKEVRFDLNTDTQKKGGDEAKDAKIEAVKPIIVDEKAKDSPRLSGPQMITCEAQQQETVILKEFEETTQEMENDYILNLPSTVEDINARAENLLPRLPERAKPPRRRKKLIPAPVEELSTDVQSETTSTTSVESVKETRAESLKVNAALKDESPPPLPPYDEVAELETCTPTYIQVVETTRHPEDIAEIVEEIIEITERRVKVPPPPPVTTSGSSATVINEIIILNSEASTSVASTTDSHSSDGLVDPIPVTSVATISVAPAPETAVVVMYPPRTLPLPVIQESLNEDQVSLPTPSEPTLSFSTLTSSATTPLEGDHNESFYDNANPFAEFQEKEEKTLSLQHDTAEIIVEAESPTKATSVEKENKADISERVEVTNKENTDLEKIDLQKDILDSQIIEVTPQIPETKVGEITTEVIPCESFEEVTPGETKVEDEKVSKAKPEVEPETMREEKPEAESETKSGVKPEAKPDTKSEDILEVKTEETERLITEASVVEETTESKSETTYKATEDMKDKQLPDSQQEACKSPELEKKEIADIDALAALTAEMFKFANEKESSKTQKQSEALKSAVVNDSSVDTSDMATQKDTSSEAPQAQTQDMSTTTETKEMVTQTEQDASPRAKSVKEMVKSNTIAIQTDATRLVRMYEAASQTDTEYETDLETESELEENASGRYDASKWLFRPTNDAKAMDPQMQELHKQQQMMIQELQQQSVMQQQKQKKAPEVPPRQFQQKMPMQVVEELKSVLAENGDDATRLKKTADPPPRWDSDLTWENALQELGLDESTLLNEIEQILGFGSLSSKSRTESHSQNELASPRPDPVARGHKLGKSRSEEAPLVPGRESSKGVWSPGRTDEKDSSGPSKIDVPDLPSFKDQPTIWSPSRGKTPPARSTYTRTDYAGYSHRVTRDDEIDIKYLEGLFRSLFSPDQIERAGSASPSLGRKEYRKITYEGTLQKRPSQENVSAPRPEESFAWKDKEIERTLKSPTSTLPKVQNPTVTLLQKKRDDPHSTSDGQIPGKRPEYLKGDDYGPAYKPDDKLYTIKREYESEDEEGSRRFAVLGPKKVHGVGPTTNDGVPTTLKSGVKSEHQGEWYRRMFDSLHKVKDDDHVIIKYKCPRARYGGYMSEPEGYDSDVGSSRYATLDRRRMHHFDADPMSSSLPRDYLADLDPFFRNTNRYVHQPGRIEDYVPGHSSLSEKEQKKNPEAEIKHEAKSQEPPPVSVNHRLGSQKMSMTHALKESGYESDSTLVFRKREDARRQPPDPRKTSQVYRQIQRGGDIPLTGLQKTAPAKPKDDYYVVYSDLDLGLHHPSLSDLAYARVSPRAMSPPAKPPVPTFGERKRSAPSKVSLAPSPPRRISSKWHPSLMKAYKDRPPIPSPRSTSAERVRETRALYSTWHREKVARSREKLGSSPARTNSLGRTSSSAKQSSEVRENFLKERRAVSESRFTLEDREKSPPRRTPSPPKASSPVRQADGREKLHHRASLKDVSPDKAGTYRIKVQEPLVTKGHSRSLSADAQRKWSNTSTESGMYSVTRHTVSSMNKIRRPSQQNAVDSRSSSADATCRRRRSSCLSPEPQLASRKSPVGRKDSRHRESPYSDVSLEVADDKKLKQSESFDTTQSNETGYSSMLDLSPSPVPDRRTEERRARKKSESPVRPHSAPTPRRSRYSHSFSEQRNKWEAITRGEAVGRRSRSPSRSTSPLRSLQLVRQVSSSFRNIPAEVFSESRRSKSLEVLTPSPHSHPQRYRQYILELRNAAPRNARISQLRRLFTSLERVHRLERSVSTVELSAADNRAHEIIDFETWKSMREKERKALEYNVLLKELNVAQKEREFLYKVTPEKKWAGDCRLRGRDVSVPELREKFDSLTDNSSEISQKRRQELENSKDTYRGLWRGSSVRDVSRMYESPERSRSSRRGSSLSLSREDSGIRARGLWTSLSLEQVNAFRDHLSEIYGSMQNVRSWRERKQMSMERSPNKSQRELAKYSVDVSETGRVLADKLRTLHVRPPPESTRRPPSRHSSPPRAAKSSGNVHQYEDQRRQLSKQLSIEFQEKVKEQKSGRRLESTPAMLDSLQVPEHPTSVSPESLSRSSPRTCYSLDISDSSEPNSLNSGDQFLLVVQKPGGHGRSNSLPPEQGSEADSSDSEMSVRTVVHKDVAGKVKFFEKRARRNSRSSERHSSRGSRLNIDEVPHYATLPSRLKQQSQNKLFSPNYLPERSVSSVNLANKGELSWRIYDKANPVSSSSIQRLSDQPKDKREQVDPTSHSRSYLYHVKTGDVNRLKDRFESPEDARRRARSLPDMNGSLSRVTPSGKTVVRGQEAGDVQYMRAKYEAPRRSRSPERWQPSRDEYLPKSKLTNTLQSLASRSPAFCEPATVERLARRDSVEKAVLRRVHTGNVEASVDRLESQQTGSGVSIIGQMYTSAPSVNELANISTLVPPRPPPPLMGPQKPQRMAVRSNIQPLLTSTPTPSPRDARAAHKQRALQVTEPVCYPPSQLHPPPGASATFTRSSSSDYNADAHRPKSRYVPPESYGSPGSAPHARGSWTQSLERPHRVTRAMTNTNPPAPSRGSSHCYTLRRHHQVHHAHHTPRAEHLSPSQPHPYSNTYSQITKPYQPYSHSPGRDQNYNNKAVSWKESPYKYESGEVNIHYRTPVRIEQKEAIPEEELARRQEEHMKKVYEQERRKKYLAELEDIERRRHTDNFTPLQKSPIPLNRYDDESSLGTLRGNRTPEPKQVAKALYNFTAQNKRELTFNKGDVIFIRRSIDKNWYEGELRGSVGIFPCNYVEIVPYDHMKTLTRKPTEGQARARFNFQAQTSMEMSLSKGELVVLTRRVDENWYEGRIGARKGIFPVSYVDTLVEPGPDRPLTPSSSPMPRPALPAANLLYNGASSYSSPYSTLGRPGSQNDSRPYNQSLTVNTQQEPVAYRALYNYKPQNDDELELLEGDVVLVMEKCDDGWFVGTSRRTGLFGTFPGNYVERI
ncbi:uncharacterized protein LOC134780011 isoform X2 [Penaeus indicus]|uniref:uncharacterized protein LOC134780011 isoform X2 n=1 Tax=Penaeus indicus TaxID=29960 RepID=UPI00300DBA91